MTKLSVGLCVVVMCLVAFIGPVSVVDALQSSHYQFNETSLGGIGTAKTSSANYDAMTSAGIIGFGNSAGINTQTNAGHETTNDPSLSFGVNMSSINFGSFSAGTTATTMSTFEVSNYTSWGYVVQTLGTPPTNGGHTIAPMTTTGPSTAGSEQFGINLVANTSPLSFGANPDHGQFGFGDAATNYDTPNNYRFVSGETIAVGPKTSGITIYTISYIVNVDSITPGGVYTGDQTIVCTATY